MCILSFISFNGVNSQNLIWYQSHKIRLVFLFRNSDLSLKLGFCFFARSSNFLHSIGDISPMPESSAQYFSNDITNLFEPILVDLGFSGTVYGGSFSMASTLFALDDASIRICSAASFSVTQILCEHIVPVLFSHDYLKKLTFGTKIETMDPGRCITSAVDWRSNDTKIYVGSVEVSRPDLFNNRILVIHDIQGFLAPLSPFSCNVDRMLQGFRRLMLRNAMLRLRSTGFSLFSLAMKVKYAELASLNKITVFAIDDQSIFSGSLLH